MEELKVLVLISLAASSPAVDGGKDAILANHGPVSPTVSSWARFVLYPYAASCFDRSAALILESAVFPLPAGIDAAPGEVVGDVAKLTSTRAEFSVQLGAAHSGRDSHKTVFQNVLLVFGSIEDLVQSLDAMKDYWHPRSKYLVVFATEEPGGTSRSCTDGSRGLSYSKLFGALWSRYQVLLVTVSEITCLDTLIARNNFLGKTNIFSGDVLSVIKRNPWFFPESNLQVMPNMFGYPLTVSVFENPPLSVKLESRENNVTGFSGDIGMLVDALSNQLNFTPKFIIQNEFNFGHRLKNGTFVGSIGDIVSGKAEITLNSRFLKFYDGINLIEFINPPVLEDSLCVYVPQPLPFPPWIAMFLSLDLCDGINLLCALAAAAIFWLLLKVGSREKRDNCTLSSSLLDVFHVVLGLSWKGIHEKRSCAERNFLIPILIFSVIVVNTLQSSLATNTSSPLMQKAVISLEDLDELGLPIATTYRDLEDTFDNGSPVVTRLARKFSVIEGNMSDLIRRVSFDRDIAFLDTTYQSVVSNYNFRNSKGQSLVHRIPECPKVYLLSYIAKKNSPYLIWFTRIVSRIFEAGLFLKFRTESSETSVGDRAFAELKSFRSFNLQDTSFVFLLLAAGVSGGLLLLAAELAWARCPPPQRSRAPRRLLLVAPPQRR